MLTGSAEMYGGELLRGTVKCVLSWMCTFKTAAP